MFTYMPQKPEPAVPGQSCIPRETPVLSEKELAIKKDFPHRLFLHWEQTWPVCITHNIFLGNFNSRENVADGLNLFKDFIADNNLLPGSDLDFLFCFPAPSPNYDWMIRLYYAGPGEQDIPYAIREYHKKFSEE